MKASMLSSALSSLLCLLCSLICSVGTVCSVLLCSVSSDQLCSVLSGLLCSALFALLSSLLCYAVLCSVCSALQGSCARRPKKIQGFSRPFHSIIQGLPVDHSIAYNPTGTGEKNTPIWSIRAWRLLIISSLRQFFYPLISNCSSKFSQSPSLVESFT